MIYKHKTGIVLRKMAESDLPELFKLKCDTWMNVHSMAILNFENQLAWYKGIASSKTDVIMICEYNGKPVGVCKFDNINSINRSCEFGRDVYFEYRATPERIGQLTNDAGVDFAFEIFHVNRLQTEVLSTNVGSLFDVTRGGFIKEGVRKHAIWKPAGYADSVMFRLLREEWVELPRVKSYGGVCYESEIYPQ